MAPDPDGLAGQPVIIGAGLAGLIAALELAPRPVVVLTKNPLGTGAASGWSQGGLAAAVLEDDSPARHAADTLEAGDGLCDPDVVTRITDTGPAAVALLERLGARFARDAAGRFACKLEAAHSRRRVVNAGGDATGAEIMRAVIEVVRRTPSITVLEAVALELLLDSVGIAGVVARRDGETCVLPTRAARHGLLFTSEGKISIKQARYAGDEAPLDSNCGCRVCQRYSRAYLRHLYASNEILAQVLNTVHNLSFYLDTMRAVRHSIALGKGTRFLSGVRSQR